MVIRKWGRLIICLLLILEMTTWSAVAEDKRFEEPTIKVFEYYESDERIDISSTWPDGADSLAIFIKDEQNEDATVVYTATRNAITSPPAIIIH